MGKYYLNPKISVGNENECRLLFYVWNNMQQRCHMSHHKDYHRYGGRGITVCREWSGRGGYSRFVEWSLPHGYQRGLMLDRIENNGNYEPVNCRFVTPKESSRNTCRTKLNEETVVSLKNKINSRKYPSKDLAKEFGISLSHISRIKTGKQWDDITNRLAIR